VFNSAVLSSEDIASLIQFSKEHLLNITNSNSTELSQYDGEVIRLLGYLIESNLIFHEGFNVGMGYLRQIFENICRIQIHQIYRNYTIINK